MKKNYVLILFIAISVIAFSKKISIMGIEYPPYMVSSTEGLAYDLMKASVEAEGHEFELNILPVKRAMIMFENDKSSLFCYAEDYLDTEGIIKENYKTVKLLMYKDILFYNKSRISKIQNKLDLKGKSIGLIIGDDIMIKMYREFGMKVETTKIIEYNLKKLYMARIDTTASIDITGFEILDKLDKNWRDKIGYSGILNIENYISILMHKEAAKDYEILSEGMIKIIESGKYLEILEKYYGKGKVPEEVSIEL